ncbi:MAG: hypothetical protein FWG11_03030 [Promicromonosporaceae bacterium]|nr:hypothetical protein [Promicromonosporaceae bacterium]
MPVEFTESAEKRGIPRDEVLFVISEGRLWQNWQDPRPPHGPAWLWIGPSRYGTLEVMAEVTPPRAIRVFHVMPLRQSTAVKVGYSEEDAQ